MFKTIPFEARKVEATEARLNQIYEAAKLGLRGDALALTAGMLPTEYRRLTQMDPVAEMAELKGRADGEAELSKVLHIAAMEGDTKVALEILKHKHDWVAKQSVQLEVTQQISITDALAQAKQRVIEGLPAQPVQDLEYRDAPKLAPKLAPKPTVREHAKADR
jgi:hypothetical protein